MDLVIDHARQQVQAVRVDDDVGTGVLGRIHGRDPVVLEQNVGANRFARKDDGRVADERAHGVHATGRCDALQWGPPARYKRHMEIERWLADLSAREFVERYYGKLPLSRSGHAQSWCRYGQWAAWEPLLADPSADVLVVRQGERYAGAPPRTAAAAEQLSAEGYTLLVRHAEKHDAGLAELAQGFSRDFAAAANIHAYATPARQFGFGWHYDAEEVFIVQLSGQKEYALRKNTVHPWPLEETLPDDMQYEREIMPMMRCLLSAGDWLYIPSGYWHKAQTVGDETAMSLALGLMPRTAMDVFDALRPELLPNLRWRQRLPVTGPAAGTSAAEQEAAYQTLVADLAQDLQRALLRSGFVKRWLSPPAGEGTA